MYSAKPVQVSYYGTAIPVHIVRALGLEPGDSLIWRTEDDTVIIDVVKGPVRTKANRSTVFSATKKPGPYLKTLIPSSIVAHLRLEPGDILEWSIRGRNIVLRVVKKEKGSEDQVKEIDVTHAT